MKRIVTTIMTLLIVLMMSALVSAVELHEGLVVVHNETDTKISVQVYNAADPIKFITCYHDEIEPGRLAIVNSGGWPGCGAYEKLTVRVHRYGIVYATVGKRDYGWVYWTEVEAEQGMAVMCRASGCTVTK